MNAMSSQQRKLVYLAAIVVLLIPIILLGMPSRGGSDSGGQLARLRDRYELGATSLGDVDPTSATMNLVLLGFRGMAANSLWQQALEEVRTKDWAQLNATVNSITKLQPHYIKVWDFHAWNLSYNVSAEWDGVEDRFFWVKQGIKFLISGTKLNQKWPEMYYWTALKLSHKIGRADEWEFFRKYFKSDPDPTYEQRADDELNPEEKDNYLVARDWYLLANEKDANEQQQKIMMPIVFRQEPAKCYMHYAGALQREGIFDEVTVVAWQRAFDEWTEIFGQELFQSLMGQVRLEARSVAEIEELAELNDQDPEAIRMAIDHFQKLVNYRYWRSRSLAESEQQTADAHREMYEGGELFKRGELVRTRYKVRRSIAGRIDELELTADQRTVIDHIMSSKTPPKRADIREAMKDSVEDVNAVLGHLESEVYIELVSEAQARLESGMIKFQNMLDEYNEFLSEDLMVDEGLMAVMLWRIMHELDDKAIPAEYPLKVLWDAHQERIPRLESEFRRRYGLR